VATEIVIPMLGITVEKGKIVEWLKNEGDAVEKGESIFVVEADKVTTEVESSASGILARILLPTGEEVPVLTVVGVITAPGEALPEKYRSWVAAQAATATAAPARAAAAIGATAGGNGPIRIVPAARKLALDKGLDLKALIGTGPDGVIVYKDVQTALVEAPRLTGKVSTLARKYAIKEGVALAGIEGSGVRGRIMRGDVVEAARQAAAPQFGKVIPMSSMRQVIARRMSQSAFTTPHIYFFTDVHMDPLLAFRRELLPDFEQAFGLRPSINDFLIKAAALAILEFPMLNATIKEQEIHVQSDINVCLAVALPEGLIVPAIRRADQRGLVDIVRERMDLVARARAGNSTREELERGTFTISSLAQYDITCFTAIINPPQSAILSVGKTREELVLDNGAVKARQVATFGLAADHRIIDGTVAAEFLQSLKAKLQRPVFTFLDL
jgi:pyruvate dehydrogenase E2 component (dihydrolipoamide acetyltransferase)